MSTLTHSTLWHLGAMAAPVLVGLAMAAGFYILTRAAVRRAYRYFTHRGNR